MLVREYSSGRERENRVFFQVDEEGLPLVECRGQEMHHMELFEMRFKLEVAFSIHLSSLT